MKNLSYPSLQRMGPFMVLLTDKSEESLCSLEAHSHQPFICVCNSCMALQCEQKVSRIVDRCWNTCTKCVNVCATSFGARRSIIDTVWKALSYMQTCMYLFISSPISDKLKCFALCAHCWFSALAKCLFVLNVLPQQGVPWLPKLNI